MNTASPPARQRDQSPAAEDRLVAHTGSVFESLFERCADAIWLYDPKAGEIVDCNAAAVKLIGAASKEQLLRAKPEDLSPPRQLDGTPTPTKEAQIVALAEQLGAYRFEWMVRAMDGREIPLEITSTPLQMSGRTIHVLVSRDISERKQTERQLLESNQSLERRVAERTAELAASEARFRALVEHAPEAIVVFDGDSGRFLFGNEHASRLYNVPLEKLTELTPADVSPEFQADGRRSVELAREKMNEALAGGKPVFEWIHRQPDGKLIPTEVRLLPLPSEGRNLIRASIIDNTERKRAEQALRESEAKFRALFEGSSQGVVLQDENCLLEANPAAVRILGRRHVKELVGKHPSETSPPFQPNGESSAVLAAKYIQECLAKGSARFDWMSCAPNGKDIPLEVALTRIEWSGRQIIQAFITDITERKMAELALRAANRDLQQEIEHRARAEESLRQRMRISTLTTEVAVALNTATGLRTMLQQCAELVVRYLEVAFARVWTLNEATQTLELEASAGCYTHLDGPHSRIAIGQYKIGLIAAEKKAHLTNTVQTDPRVSDKNWARREGMVAFAGYPLLLEGRVLGVLAMFSRRPLPEDVLLTLGSVADALALGIERKRAQAALAESEARFSAAFQASPVFISIFRKSDEKYVLVNDALANWLGCRVEDVLGRTSRELDIFENPADRVAVWRDLRSSGAVRQREYRWLNRRGKPFTILLSAETITIGNEPHVLSMALDISQRKSAELEMINALAREKELSQLKSNFVSLVSHEFRTPLGIIQSSAELLRDFYQKMEPGEREDQLESITRNARRMAGMMEEILVLSRLDAEKLEFQPTALDLAAFCRRVVEEVLSATNHRCAIELSLHSIPAEARADERLLGHIFTNLLSNAVKYSDPGATVRFAFAREGAEMVGTVRDHGVGISEADQEKLFTAFHRGANVGTRPGTGLGLMLVKRCAELHGGKVHVTSKIGEGTTVVVRLPLLGKES